MTANHAGPKGISDGSFAVDFANTVACGACQVEDALARPRGLSAWLDDHSELGVHRVSPEELRELRDFRRYLRGVLAAAVDQRQPPRSAIAAVNRAAQRFQLVPSIGWLRGRWRFREIRVAPDRVARITGPIAVSAIRILSGHQGGRLCRCRGRGCAHFLLARTRTQIWCSPTGCGNRARVARHYWRLRAPSIRRPPLRARDSQPGRRIPRRRASPVHR